MRLTDPTDLAAAVFERRLLKDHPRPVAVALSGGGDSVALLLVAHAWARRAGRSLAVLSVDHGLNPDSARWIAACRRRAADLGLPFQGLEWTGDKPAAGLPAAARAARHALLADAARRLGAKAMLMGHTADDILEAQAMRQAGSTTPDPREWSPSPAWPEGRDVFVLRPLLGARRAELRTYLATLDETWIEDPANDNPAFARARARRTTAGDACLPALLPTAAMDFAASVAGGACGLSMPRAAAADPRLLGMAAVCAGGGARRPAAARLARLSQRLIEGEAFTAGLAGARIEAAGERVLLLREAGEAARGGLAALALRAGEEAVWDGRYGLTASRPGLRVAALAGSARKLSKAEQAALRSLPPAARRGLPLVEGEGVATCPLLAEGPVAARALVLDRFRAAAGLVSCEPA